MSVKAIIFAALMLASAETSAAVQGRMDRESALAAQAMRNFAICAANRSPGGARRLLTLDRRAPTYSAELRRFARGHGDCAPGATLQFAGILLRGGLAEGLLRAPLRDRSLGPLVAYDSARPAIASDNEADTMALCTVREAPEAVQALFAAEPGAPAEDAAYATLMPALAGCLAQGQRLAANRPGVRALLAISAFRLVEQNRGPIALSRLPGSD